MYELASKREGLLLCGEKAERASWRRLHVRCLKYEWDVKIQRLVKCFPGGSNCVSKDGGTALQDVPTM